MTPVKWRYGRVAVETTFVGSPAKIVQGGRYSTLVTFISPGLDQYAPNVYEAHLYLYRHISQHFKHPAATRLFVLETSGSSTSQRVYRLWGAMQFVSARSGRAFRRNRAISTTRLKPGTSRASNTSQKTAGSGQGRTVGTRKAGPPCQAAPAAGAVRQPRGERFVQDWRHASASGRRQAERSRGQARLAPY